mgnify:FL=1
MLEALLYGDEPGLMSRLEAYSTKGPPVHQGCLLHNESDLPGGVLIVGQASSLPSEAIR